MKKKRGPRLKQKLYALLLLLLLMFLLELNRFLPGVWPGGGDSSGMRTHAASLVGDGGTNPRPDETGETIGMEAPPEGRPPPEIPRNGAVIEVRLADGTFLTDWKYGSGPGGATSRVADPEFGRRRLKSVTEPIRVRTDTHSLEHNPLSSRVGARHWIVVLPEDPCSLARQRSKATIEVRDELGQPLADTTLQASTRGGGSREFVTDDEGRVELTGLRALTRVARMMANSVVGDSCWVAPRGTDDIVMQPGPHRMVHIGSANGVDEETARFVTPDGRRVKGVDKGRAMQGARAKFLVPVEADEPLVLVWRSDFGAEHAAVVDGDTVSATPMATRILQIDVMDAEGNGLDAAGLVALYNQSLGAGGTEPIPLRSVGQRSAASGAYRIAVPVGVAADLVVASDGFAPRSVRIPAGTTDDALGVTLTRGRTIDVLVRRADGSTSVGAGIRAAVGSGPGRVEVWATADVDGRARLAGLAGTVAIFVRGGRETTNAMQVIDAETATSPVEITLKPASALQIAVADPNGVPLEGVRVHVSTERGAPHIEQPGPPHIALSEDDVDTERRSSWEPETPPHGLIAFRHLPAGRTYRVKLYKPGYEPQTIREVRPGPDTVYFVTLVPK